MSSQTISAPRDANRVPALLGTSNVDGSTPVVIYADPSTHRLLVTGTGTGPGTVNLELPTGTVDGSNTSFTVVNTPRWLSIDGLNKFNATYNPSNPGWSYVAGTITILDGSPPVLSIVSFY